jgi:nicotinamidase/pyrazinamidase
MPKTKNALIVVDVQNDFCPGGALVVEKGDQIIPRLNILIKYARMSDWIVVASADCHPAQTVHFDEWLPHCIAGTSGADFHPNLELPSSTIIFRKGMSDRDNGYSAFEGIANTMGETDLRGYLYNKGVTDVYVAGLALDYCVKATVLDSVYSHFCTHLVLDVTQPVNSDNTIQTLMELIDAEVQITITRRVLP